ncbi:YIP1 family protein [Aestuariibius sp. HNIBRBA575]|uniref:YIP1 family protein n=1 Tax=Aestuariibius sp. HNIBRBA575 TaxID=3233343 RepID=UPI0034A0FDD0
MPSASTRQHLLDFGLQTITNPRSVAQSIVALHFSRDIGWLLMVLAITLNGLFVGVGAYLVPEVYDSIFPGIVLTPITFSIISGGMLIISVFTVFYTGLMLGGQGRFSDAIMLTAWLNFVMVVLLGAQLLLTFVSPLLGVIATVARFVIGLRGYVIFTDVMLNFDNVGRAVLTLFIAFAGSVLGLSLILALIGVGAAAGGG